MKNGKEFLNNSLSPQLLKFLEDTCIFFQPWWLEAVSPGHWGYAVAQRGDDIVGVLPYTYKVRLKKYLLLEMPLLTPYLGPWLNLPHKKYEAKGIEEEKKIMNELMNSLPHFSSYNHFFHYSVTNWLPFYWRGYSQSTIYTYLLEDISNYEKVFANFSHAKRKNINKARDIVEVKQDLSSKDFYAHLVYTLSQKRKNVQYPFIFFENFYNVCYLHNAGKAFYAVDKENNIHSAIFVVWDKRSAYYLISSIDPKFTTSGSVSLLVLEAIKYCSEKVLKFDFCGSMIETIERSSREFGGKQIPYFNIAQITSPLVKYYRMMWRFLH